MPRYFRTREYSEPGRRSARFSRAGLYYRGMRVACRWHAFVAPQDGDEIREGYRKLRERSIVRTRPDIDTCGKCEEHERIFDSQCRLTYLYKFVRKILDGVAWLTTNVTTNVTTKRIIQLCER